MVLANQNLKLVEGGFFPIDFSESEFEEKSRSLQFDPAHIAFRIFPTHYPTDTSAYYGGFEVYAFRDPTRIVVGGVEIGPASRAGVHWGDTIVALNGVDPRGLAPAKLESLLSAKKPSKMKLVVSRAGVTRKFNFTPAKVAAILAENGHKMVDGTLVPIDLDDSDIHCFQENPQK